MSNQWLRLWHDMPNDPKWRTISRISGQKIGDVIAVYVHMLVSASTNTVKRGVTTCNAEDVSTALDIQVAQVEAIFSAMQGRVLDESWLSGWELRQPKKEDNSSDRVKAYRERNAVKRDVTLCNARLDKEEDKDKKEEKSTKKENSSFEIFFETFPNQRKGNREKVEAAYRQALKRSTAEEIFAGLKSYLDSDEVRQGFAKGGAAWLNDDRWKVTYIKPPLTDKNKQPLSNVATL